MAPSPTSPVSVMVVGSDGTADSGAAVSMAADLAASASARVHLVTADNASAGGGGAVLGAPIPSRVHGDHGRASAALEAQAATLRRRGLEVEVHVCPGPAAEALCEVAETVGADLIVVGNRRMQGRSRLLGSVPNRVAHHAPCSVLIARTTD